MGNTSQTHAGPDSTGQHARDAGDRQNACRPLGIDNERKRSKAASAKKNNNNKQPARNASAQCQCQSSRASAPLRKTPNFFLDFLQVGPSSLYETIANQRWRALWAWSRKWKIMR